MSKHDYLGKFFAAALVAALPTLAAAQGAPKPDLTGTWVLDVEASDDPESEVLRGAGENRAHGMARVERDRLVERLISLARAIETLEIEQTERDFKVFDEAENLRIYYLDGRSHTRQTPWGAELEAVAKWNGPQLEVQSKGDEVGEVLEIYGLEGRRLVFIVKIKHREFQDEVTIRNYYDRGSD